jgi:hypothetical protein
MLVSNERGGFQDIPILDDAFKLQIEGKVCARWKGGRRNIVVGKSCAIRGHQLRCCDTALYHGRRRVEVFSRLSEKGVAAHGRESG